MDPRLLQLYIQELAHVRDAGAEFATRFPKIASRLAMDATEVQDPYVERLLEGFAFLTARVQLRLNEEFPRFTEQLLNRISPNFLAPVPAMGVVRFNPNLTDVALKKGVKVEAGTVLQSQVAKGINTPCKFKVGHSLTLWPLAITAVEHAHFKGSAPRVQRNEHSRGPIRSALHITIETNAKSMISHLPIDAIDFHVSCGDEYAYALFERICYQSVSVGVRAPGQSQWHFLPADHLQALGLEEDEALLPPHCGQFSGMRLLQEFFAFPPRFLFFRIHGLQRFLSKIEHAGFELALCFADVNSELDRVVDLESLALNCTPVVNLFEHSCDRVMLDNRLHEVQVQPNRTKPQDFEVHSVLSVQGYGPSKVLILPPLYADSSESNPDSPRFMDRRVPTRVSDKQAREGGRSSYVGSDVYLGLTLPTGELIDAHGLEQLSVRALCTNRDLPLLMPVGHGATDLAWSGNLPVQSVRFLRGPSRPKAAIPNGPSCWQLIEHLSLNYLGLIDQEAVALGQLLALFADPSQQAHQQIARALVCVESQILVSRVVRQGRPAVVRGLQVTLTLDEMALQGNGVAVLGSVLARYLAAHVSVNSFVQTRVKMQGTGAILEFPARSGNRPLL